MKTIDIKSVIIGVLGSALLFLELGSSMQDKNMGNIVANSLTIISDGTAETGFILIKNSDGKKIARLGRNQLVLKDVWTGGLDLYGEENRRLTILDSEALQLSFDDINAYITVDEMGANFTLRDEKTSVNLGASMETSSHISLYNTRGEQVWGKLSGK